MIEIRIHGRGGQGGVTLAKIIATSRFLEGQSVQAFGLYAAERSGAPIQAFCRFDDEKITNRNLIYHPDHVIVLDPTLIGPAIAEGLAANGWILINSTESPEAFADRFPLNRLATVDATQIARDNDLGTTSVPIVNTALAGAAARILDLGLESMKAALRHLTFVGPNLVAASAAYEGVRSRSASTVRVTARATAGPSARPPTPGFLSGGGGELPGIRTGSWATLQPKRQQWIPPCNHICPAGNDVRGFLQAMAREEIDQALDILLRTSPFPAVCGRVCPAPCMDACNRIEIDGAVNVRDLERFAGDQGSAPIEAEQQRGERIAVIGSGPAGSTAAYHLALFGYDVTIYEGALELGGLLRAGIPEYRLPDTTLDRELARILDLGVTTHTGYKIDRAGLLDLARRHDAVLVATGLQELRGLQLGTDSETSVEQGIDFLDRAHSGEIRVDGEQVVVVGGGNTAIDAARTALRLGASTVRIIYRRSRQEMPAIEEEIEHAIEESVEIDYLTQPISIRRDTDNDDRVSNVLVCRRMELGKEDDSGRRRPVEIEGSDFDLPYDRVILALGQSRDLSVFAEGTEIREGENLLGLLEKPVFAIGDLATGDGTVAAAIGSGRRAAFHIHEVLNGDASGDRTDQAMRRTIDVWRDEVIRSENMRLHLFERQAPAPGSTLTASQRKWNFEEVHSGLPDTSEAKRCLSCGVCDECDRCVTFCPEGVLKRVGPELVFDYSYCKGCGVCAVECPRNVIFMTHL